MPLYLVRWPLLKASIIRARDETELVDKLDEVGDPGGCTWQVYRGPLWIDFDVPIEFAPNYRDDRRPMSRDELGVRGVEKLHTNQDWVQSTIPTGSDTARGMSEKILGKAFPALSKVVVNDEHSEAQLREALLDDLEPLIKYDWRQAQLGRRTDKEAEIMKLFGVSMPISGMTNRPSGDDE